MSDRHTFNIEEAIGWNGLRAMQEAAQNAPAIPAGEDVWVEVKISLFSDSWPGKGPKGRSRSRVIGYAMCGYCQPKGDTQ